MTTTTTNTGTQDMHFATMLAALDFRDAVASGNDDEIMTYIHNLAVQGGQLLAQEWNTELLLPTDSFGAMVDVRVPCTNKTLRRVIYPSAFCPNIQMFRCIRGISCEHGMNPSGMRVFRLRYLTIWMIFNLCECCEENVVVITKQCSYFNCRADSFSPPASPLFFRLFSLDEDDEQQVRIF